MSCEKAEGSLENRIDRAASLLAGGGCVVYPTETFYALGASLGSARALERVNAIKGRPRAKPLPVIIGSMEQLGMVMAEDADKWPGFRAAQDLMRLFWPGPLSVIVPARRELPPQIMDAMGFVSVRLTPHEQARELCVKVGWPLAATSANVSGDQAVSDVGKLSPAVCLGADFVLGGDPSPSGGLASTVVRPLGGRTVLLTRIGALPARELERAGFVVSE